MNCLFPTVSLINLPDSHYKNGDLTIYRLKLGFLFVVLNFHCFVAIGEKFDYVQSLAKYNDYSVYQTHDTLPKLYKYPMDDFINELVQQLMPYDPLITAEIIHDLMK